ncbi:FAD-dependent oxidoreductase, partial [Verrucomicrobiota bacterium]
LNSGIDSKINTVVRIPLLWTHQDFVFPDLTKGQGYLEREGVEVRTGAAVAAISQRGTDHILVRLNSGKEIVVDLVMLSIGANRDLALAEQASLISKKGICVDSTLKTSAEAVFACGDIAQFDGIMRCSVPAAVLQGKVAGANACAFLSGSGMQEYKEKPIPLAFKYKGLQIRAGEVLVTDREPEAE